MGVTEIRESAASDRAAVEALYPAAFPDEDLLPLVRGLMASPEEVVSLVALRDGALVGHIAFTSCRVGDCETPVALLAPLAVAPDAQRSGVGAALIEQGCETMAAIGASQVFVLGDPAYYSRFGFDRETAVTPPYPLPDAWAEAWRSRRLGSRIDNMSGKLSTPAIWRDPALWGP